jgi:uncharacterized protein
MSRQAEVNVPASIDGLEFAAEGGVIEASVPLTSLPRLAEVVSGTAGSLDCCITGERDDDGKSWLRLWVCGNFDLVCQRCLAALVFPLQLESRLLLVPPGRPWPEEELAEDGFDAVPAEKEMALLPLIEEEVLLALPIAPRHESCETPVPLVKEHEASPFAALAGFKKGV